MKKNVLVGVSGGIAAVKIPELINLLKQSEIDIKVIMTVGAVNIIDPLEIEKITKNKVFTNLFKNKINTKKILKKRKVEHTNLAGKADLILIAPATANIIAKLAMGIADDYLTTTVLASVCKVLICPSMNVHMWENPATQENIEILKKRGFEVINPDKGLLACGYEGQGRLADINVIAGEAKKILNKGSLLNGKRIIVTSGGTIEPIDDVRFIANKSTGKMGAAISESAYLYGAKALVIRAKNSIKPRYNLPEKIFETAEDLENILKKETTKADIIFHAAAVSDFSVNKIRGKIESKNPISLKLVPREKILSKIKKWNPKIFLIGFKAEANLSEEEFIKKTKQRMLESDADIMVANEIGKEDRGFEADTNEVWIINKEKVKHIPLSTKREIAEKIIASL